MKVNSSRPDLGLLSSGIMIGFLIVVSSLFIFYPNSNLQILGIAGGAALPANFYAVGCRSYWKTRYGEHRYLGAIISVLVAIDLTWVIGSILVIIGESFSTIFNIMSIVIGVSFMLMASLFIRTLLLWGSSRLESQKKPDMQHYGTLPLVKVSSSLRNSVLFSLIASVFASLGYGLVALNIESALEISVVIFPVLFFVLYLSFRAVSPEADFYSDRLRMVYSGSVRKVVLFSDISRVQLKGLGAMGSRVIIYGRPEDKDMGEESKGNHKKETILAIVQGNPRMGELGGKRLFEWLNSAIDSNPHCSPGS